MLKYFQQNLGIGGLYVSAAIPLACMLSLFIPLVWWAIWLALSAAAFVIHLAVVCEKVAHLSTKIECLFDGFSRLCHTMPMPEQKNIAKALVKKIQALPENPQSRLATVKTLLELVYEAETYSSLTVRHANARSIIKGRTVDHDVALMTEKMPPDSAHALKKIWAQKVDYHLKVVAAGGSRFG